MLVTIEEAAQLLKQGQVVALPTETVYGLAASIYCKGAVEKIFAIKNRPLDNPLITHIHSAEELFPFLVKAPQFFDILIEKFWPGPLTLVLPVKKSFPSYIRRDLPTAAFRIPSHPLTLEVLRRAGPLVMPSANLSGRPSATNSTHVEEDFSKSFPVLEGGVCEMGMESTVLLFLQGKWVVGRRGCISLEEIADVIGYLPDLKKSRRPLCPGQKYRHYSPKCTLIMSEDSSLGEAILGFEEGVYPKDRRVFSLGSFNDPQQVCRNLYAVLRSLDIEGVSSCWVDGKFPKEGLWATIAERLEKAAGKNTLPKN